MGLYRMTHNFEKTDMAKGLQRATTKDLRFDYKELPLNNQAFALQMPFLEKKQKEMEKKECEFGEKRIKRLCSKEILVEIGGRNNN
ncbi:hypothetical protein ACH3XW_1095 [Acanthocheilonema viteae]